MLLFAIIGLMCLSFISLECIRLYQARKDVDSSIKIDDMYDKNNYSNVLCELNNYFFQSDKKIEELKGSSLFITNEIRFFYDNQVCKFYVEYRYKSKVYKRAVSCIECNKELIFIPEERKYIGL